MDTTRPSNAPDVTRVLQMTGRVCGAAGAVFWIYTFYFISRLPPSDGSGFQWLAELPLTATFVFLCVPALMLSRIKRLAGVSAGCGIAALIAFAILWNQLLEEFGGYAAR